MKSYRFLTPALLEVEAASQFYETNREGLGRDFLDEIDATVQRILANPEAWQVLEESIHSLCQLLYCVPVSGWDNDLGGSASIIAAEPQGMPPVGDWGLVKNRGGLFRQNRVTG